jgi:predicted ATP-dependent serine protease
MGIHKLSEVVPEVVGRRTSTMDEIDFMYGKRGSWGLPDGRISLWSGGQGTGKTRLLVQFMKGWDALGWTSMINQGEVSPAQFAFEKFEGYKSDRILISDSMGIGDQIDYIKTYSPAFVITDSVQQVEEYDGGRGAKKIIRELRKTLSHTGTHVIFISQLTADGKTKGGTELPHEVDIEAYLERWAPETCPDLISLQINKNRYGNFGRKAILAHKEWGMEVQSNERLKDKDWLADHGSRMKPDKVKGRGAVSRMLWGK